MSVYEQQSLATATIDQLSLQDQLTYAEGHLATLGESVLALSKDQDFRTWLHSETEKQIDGDYNVLFETLYQATLPNHRNSVYEEMNVGLSRLNSQRDLIAASHAFEGIENTTYFPQIFIPFYEDLKANAVINSRSFEKAPVIVISPSDNKDKKEYVGYTLDPNNNLVQTDFMVDEKYAQENEVWVMSINERLDGCLPEMLGVGTTSSCFGGGGSGGGGSAPTGVNGKFPEMKVKEHKESWVSGGSEIAIIRLATWSYGVNPSTGNVEYYSVGGADANGVTGTEIRRFKRRWIRKEWWRGTDFKYWSNWNTDQGDVLCYVIFECDGPFVGKRDAWLSPEGTPTQNQKFVQFRSADDFYINHSIVDYQTNGYSANKFGIEFYSRTQ